MKLLGIFMLLMAVVIACSSEPDAFDLAEEIARDVNERRQRQLLELGLVTPEGAMLRPGEVMGLVQEYVSQRPGCSGSIPEGLFALMLTEVTPRYLGDGVWRAGPIDPSTGRWDWEVFDRTQIVHSMGGGC